MLKGKLYMVLVREVHIQPLRVFAKDPEEAIKFVKDGMGVEQV